MLASKLSGVAATLCVFANVITAVETGRLVRPSLLHKKHKLHRGKRPHRREAHHKLQTKDPEDAARVTAYELAAAHRLRASSGGVDESPPLSYIAADQLRRIRKPKTVTKVWISSFSRSGSSTMEQLIDLALPASGQNVLSLRRSLFALFEPCHEGDVYRGKKITKNDLSMCPSFLHDVKECNFGAVQKLFYWEHPRARHTNVPYSGLQAEIDCKRAAVRVFKTITMNNMARQILPVLKADPTLHVVHLIRDPRAILASRLHTPTFKHVNDSDIIGMCSQMRKNARVTHPRLLTVKFEEWVTNPRKLSKEIYQFLGLNFGERQEMWIKGNFNPPPDVFRHSLEAGPFGSCRLNSSGVAFKWKQELNGSQLDLFKADACQDALKLYGYQPSLL